MNKMKHRDESWLREKYVEEELSCIEISKFCDVSRSQVHRNLKKFDIETRPQGTKDFGSKIYHNEEWLREKIHDENLSYTEIGNICGVSKQTIYNSVKKLDIDVGGNTRYRNESWFREEYLEKDKTLMDLADECNVSKQTIIKWKKKHDIPTQYPTGKNNPHTKSPEECVKRERGEDWNRQRNRALERADYACENPYRDEDTESLGQNPDVHHIIPYRYHNEIDGINDLSNLVALCRGCHSKAEPSRVVYE